MPLYLRPPAMAQQPAMDDNSDNSDVSVVDVYDIASEIGKECEKLIDAYGNDSIATLMPKVINALELLESLATKNERENTIVQELTAKIQQLESDKIGKAEDRQRFEKVYPIPCAHTHTDNSAYFASLHTYLGRLSLFSLALARACTYNLHAKVQLSNIIYVYMLLQRATSKIMIRTRFQF